LIRNRKEYQYLLKNPKPVKAKIDIIDDFIKNEPSISRPKAEFYDPADKARESVVDNENIVSETLANIFMIRDIFIKLLKFIKIKLEISGKSSYFAALIKKAEKD